ncbi:MAG TPA: F0F1 ATP synthase subunit A [Rhodospirillaceae bacterium]|nr:F0F1 ATP synthase subunit A [Rhodospirillaceae bacterium]HAT34381.1 F0F1 ATP synthase subunit A [Rhodospirillaceae bacterium]|tara:strand:- start:517 stop:1260 length:744 start_codon:yes stop_codon:yes gene_type:complete
MADASGNAQSPLAQFEIKPLIELKLGGVDVSFTNSALFMTIALVLIAGFMLLATRKRATIPGRWQVMAEISYEFIAGLIRDTIGAEGRKYFPFVFAVFMFVLIGNLLGMTPYSFTFTSHIVVTFALAFAIFIGVTILGFVKHGLHFFSFFLPPGTPWVMAPLLIPIEVISYLSRPISLSVRLFANMLAGHTLLKVIAGFIGVLGVAGILPLALVTALTGLEILIAFLQAYVFAILTCLYINDALHLH